MATHSSIPAWEIPWTEEPGGLQSKGSQRAGHDWVTNYLCSSRESSICYVKRLILRTMLLLSANQYLSHVISSDDSWCANGSICEEYFPIANKLMFYSLSLLLPFLCVCKVKYDSPRQSCLVSITADGSPHSEDRVKTDSEEPHQPKILCTLVFSLARNGTKVTDRKGILISKRLCWLMILLELSI